MNELQNRLKQNYLNEIKEYVELLKSKSYVLCRNNGKWTVWCYNARLNDFYQKMTLTDLVRDVMEQNKNWYDFVMTHQDFRDIIFAILPEVTGDDIDRFRKYNEALKNIKPKKELQSDRKKLNRELSDRKRPVLLNAPDDVQEQIQALINEGVVFCRYSNGYALKKNGFFIYNKNTQKYDILTVTSICTILKNTFSTDFDAQKLQWRLKKYYQGLIESSLPHQWNVQRDYEEILKTYQNPTLDGTQWV